MRRPISASREALNTVNPMRLYTERYFVEPMRLSKKDLIKVSIGELYLGTKWGLHPLLVATGDPSVFGNLPPHPAVCEALKAAVETNGFNGLAYSSGVPEARQCIAEQLSKYPSNHPLAADVSSRTRPTCLH